MTGKTLAFFHHISRTVGRPYSHKQMDVIGLNSQFDDLPSLFGTCLFNQPFAVYGNRARKHGLAAFGCPDKVIDDQMHTMFVALVVQGMFCVQQAAAGLKPSAWRTKPAQAGWDVGRGGELGPRNCPKTLSSFVWAAKPPKRREKRFFGACGPRNPMKDTT